MDLETDHWWAFLLHMEIENMPNTLTGRDILRIKIELNIILTATKLHYSVIMALVDMIVDVFDSFDWCNGLNIDMAAIFPNEIITMCNYPQIINLMTSDLKSLASVTSPEIGIGIIIDCGLIMKGLWKISGTLSTDLVWGISIMVLRTTWSMDH